MVNSVQFVLFKELVQRVEQIKVLTFCLLPSLNVYVYSTDVQMQVFRMRATDKQPVQYNVI